MECKKQCSIKKIIIEENGRRATVGEEKIPEYRNHKEEDSSICTRENV